MARNQKHIAGLVFAAGLSAVFGGQARAATPGVTFTSIAGNAYGTGDVNSCSIAINNLVTYGGYQFAAYYNTSQNLMLARRVTGGSTWQTYSSGFSVTDASDDHNVIALAIDATGRLSMSWDMHNVGLNYAQSTTSVLSSSLSSIGFNNLSDTTANRAAYPTLYPSGGSTTNEVTYPEFYHIPNSDNLIFTYRNGGAGGGSGNGNQYANIYDPHANTWSQTFVINGEQTSVNAYMNNLVYNSSGNLLATWTWRETPNWQTNNNIMFAQSPDNGVSWYQQGGTTPYGLPIIQSGTPANSVAQVIKTITINDSFINQTSMAVDKQDRPMVAGYWSPNWTPTFTNPLDSAHYGNGSGSGDPNRQYMLEYYTGSQWITSQVSSRTHDTSIDTSGADVRDLGRPIVLVDKQNRILMITRSVSGNMGTYANAAASGNNIVIYYTTDSMAALNGGSLPNTLTWSSIALDTANMGAWEPTYDSTLWASSNTLDMFYEPVGLSGEGANTAKVMEWNEPAFFALTWNNTAATGDGVTWNTVGSQNFANGGGPTNFHTGDTLTFNDNNNSHYAVSISGTVSPVNLTVNNSAANYTFSGTGQITGTTSLTKSGTASLTISNANTFTGGTIINGGTIIVANPTALGTGGITIHANGTLQLQSSLPQAVTAPSLQLDGSPNAWSATIDITNNKLIIEDAITHATTLATLQNQVLYGTSHTTGILSTGLPAGTAIAVLDNAVTQFTTFGGVPVDANAILLAPELLGDANLDGKVDLNDLNIVLNNLGNPNTNWTSGNFDGATAIDLNDLNDVLNNLGQTFPNPTSAEQALSAQQALAAQAAPEPGTLALLASTIAFPLLRRSRRRYK